MSPFKICDPLTTNKNKPQKQFIQYKDHHHCCESGMCTGAQRGTRTAHYTVTQIWHTQVEQPGTGTIRGPGQSTCSSLYLYVHLQSCRAQTRAVASRYTQRIKMKIFFVFRIVKYCLCILILMLLLCATELHCWPQTIKNATTSYTGGTFLTMNVLL